MPACGSWPGGADTVIQGFGAINMSSCADAGLAFEFSVGLQIEEGSSNSCTGACAGAGSGCGTCSCGAAMLETHGAGHCAGHEGAAALARQQRQQTAKAGQYTTNRAEWAKARLTSGHITVITVRHSRICIKSMEQYV